MTAYREGQLNLLGIVNPGVYVIVGLPNPVLTGVPTNIEAIVGVASWGKTNTVIPFSNLDDGQVNFGPPQLRTHDIVKHVAAATQGGKAINFRAVRVTDGTDVAASASLPSNGGTATAICTGTLGNSIAITFQNTAAIGAFAAVVFFPGRTPERFDNLYKSLSALTVTPGTGYTSVPALAVSAPQIAGGKQAQALATLKAVTAAVAAGGSGYAVNDTITLSNGVVATVATVSSGAVATVTLSNPGSISSGPAPTNPVAQSATSGTGTGATFNLTWGLGPATITAGSGYTSAPTVTLSGGGGTGGSYAPVVSFWAALADAINNGTVQRARSSAIVFTAGTSTADPVLNTPYTLAGGTDGASGVTTSHLIGQDAQPRTGMYAYRGIRNDIFGTPDTLVLGESTDSTVWPAMLSFGIQESIYPIGVMANGTSISDAVTERATRGVDDPNFKVLSGDWPTVYIGGLGDVLVSPAAVAQGLYGNLSPEQGSINKALLGVTSTTTSQSRFYISDAEEAVAQTGGVDFIGRSAALGQDFFSLMTGRNTSSNTLANGDEFTRLTNFLARILQGAATRAIVGKLQSVRPDDPTRQKAKAVLDSLGALLVDTSLGSDGYGLIDAYATKCDEFNNTAETVRRGYLFAVFTAQYLTVVRYFVIKLAANGTVQVTVQDTDPTAQNFLALAA